MTLTSEHAGPVQHRPLPKMNQVLRTIRSWIEKGRMGWHEQLPSERLIADQLSVPRHTVRLALQELECQGLIVTHGRRRLVTGRAAGNIHRHYLRNTVIILAEIPDADFIDVLPGDERYLEIGAVHALSQTQHSLLAINAESLDREHFTQMLEDRPAGVISYRDTSLLMAEASLLHQIHDAGVPMALYACEHDWPDYDTVEPDHIAGAYDLTHYLIGRGCKRILRYWELRDRSGQDPTWLHRRNDGYIKAVTEAGLDPLTAVQCPALPFHTDTREQFDMKVNQAVGNLYPLLKQYPDIDAIMTVSDSCVFHVAAACRVLDRSPNVDIAITGYDNYWTRLRERKWESATPVATVDKRHSHIGGSLVELLTQRISGELGRLPVHRRITPRLIVETGAEYRTDRHI